MSTDVGQQIEQWTPFEAALTSAQTYVNPYADVDVSVEFEAPSGRRISRDAFWDGGPTWRVRAAPDELGRWEWRTICNHLADAGLNGMQGHFECVPYEGDNPLYVHGTLRISANRRHFEHADGAPFFWLGDTCWNGVLRADPADWRDYLTTRRQQGFNVIQYIGTQWRGLSKDPLGETAFEKDDHDSDRHSHINPRFFQRLDVRVAAINAHGLVAAPILIHDNGDRDSDGNFAAGMSEAGTIRLARTMLARWGGYHAVYTLGGDGRYDADGTARWQRIGRAVFGDPPSQLATMHPAGVSWLSDGLLHEPWLSFIVYQSGHYDSRDELRWFTHGAPAHEWRHESARPFIDAEANYEAHVPFKCAHMIRTAPFTDHEVRRAAYWSLLISPTAGTTYGHHHIWPWNEQPAEPEGHADIGYGVLPVWRDGLHAPGAASMTVLRRLFDGVPWWMLRPEPAMIVNPPDSALAPEQFIAAARAEDGSFALVYLPVGQAVRVNLTPLTQPISARWFDPRTGETTAVAIERDADEIVCTPPDAQDWILWLGA